MTSVYFLANFVYYIPFFILSLLAGVVISILVLFWSACISSLCGFGKRVGDYACLFSPVPASTFHFSSSLLECLLIFLFLFRKGLLLFLRFFCDRGYGKGVGAYVWVFLRFCFNILHFSPSLPAVLLYFPLPFGIICFWGSGKIVGDYISICPFQFRSARAIFHSLYLQCLYILILLCVDGFFLYWFRVREFGRRAGD